MTAKANKELQNICRIIGETVDAEKIYLFGSHAYGTPDDDSDFDLCVIIPDDTLRPVDAIKRIRRALYKQQQTPLDIIVCQSSKFRQRQTTPSIERKIAREGRLLHERQGFEQQTV